MHSQVTENTFCLFIPTVSKPFRFCTRYTLLSVCSSVYLSIHPSILYEPFTCYSLTLEILRNAMLGLKYVEILLKLVAHI